MLRGKGIRMRVREIILVIITMILYTTSLLPFTFSAHDETVDLRQAILQVQKLAHFTDSNTKNFPSVFKDSILLLKGIAGYDVLLTNPLGNQDSEEAYLLVVQKIPYMLSCSHLLPLPFCELEHVAQQKEIPVALNYPPETPPPMSFLV